MLRGLVSDMLLAHFLGDFFELVGPLWGARNLEVIRFAGARQFQLKVGRFAGALANGNGEFTTMVIDWKGAEVGNQFADGEVGDFGFNVVKEAHARRCNLNQQKVNSPRPRLRSPAALRRVS